MSARLASSISNETHQWEMKARLRVGPNKIRAERSEQETDSVNNHPRENVASASSTGLSFNAGIN